MTIDLNRRGEEAAKLTTLIESLLDAGVEPEPLRDYLGASLIGDECLRKVQYSWLVEERHPARMRRIFDRGHAMEAIIGDQLIRAGFALERDSPRCGFAVVDG